MYRLMLSFASTGYTPDLPRQGKSIQHSVTLIKVYFKFHFRPKFRVLMTFVTHQETETLV